MLVNHSGEFLHYLAQSPVGKSIDCIFAYSHGFMVAGEGGHVWTFAGQDDEHAPYALSPSQPLIRSEDRDKYFHESIKQLPNIEVDSITSLALNYDENTLFYLDRKNQLMRISVNLSGPLLEHTISRYVNCPYHS